MNKGRGLSPVIGLRKRMDDILLNKGAIIERCLRRVREEYSVCPDLADYTHQDAIILNLERACQAAIDMGMHIIAEKHLGVPQNSANAFDLLRDGKILSADIAKAMKAMVGFRNIAVHEYQVLDLGVLRYVVTEGYRDLIAYCKELGIVIVAE
jgi:uncharacterized protein YutE (UPF0331/DUF86 family)